MDEKELQELQDQLDEDLVDAMKVYDDAKESLTEAINWKEETFKSVLELENLIAKAKE